MYDPRVNNLPLDIHAAVLAHMADEMIDDVDFAPSGSSGMHPTDIAKLFGAYQMMMHAYELMKRAHDSQIKRALAEENAKS